MFLIYSSSNQFFIMLLAKMLKICLYLSNLNTLMSPLIDASFLVQIVNGPKYQLAIAGSGVMPSLGFSFKSYNFGPCFLHRSGLPVPKVSLIIENRDTKDIRFGCPVIFFIIVDFV